MAISKERLEELIKEKGCVYFPSGKDVIKKTLNHKYHEFFITNDDELYEHNREFGIGVWKHKLCKLFETKEECKEYIEFGNVTRIEKLELPTWKQVEIAIQNNAYIMFEFINQNGQECDLVVEPYEAKITVNGIGGCYDIWSLSKENYDRARRLCVKLFKGEN